MITLIKTNANRLIKQLHKIENERPPNLSLEFKSITTNNLGIDKVEKNTKSSLASRMFSLVQPFILILLVGALVATFAVFVDVCSDFLIDLKDGYCSFSIYMNRSLCCNHTKKECKEWKTWPNFLSLNDSILVEWVLYVLGSIFFALISTFLVKKLSKYAGGSGISEIKGVLDGFYPEGLFDVKTLLAKTISLIFAVASGLSLGKEGPSVHIACCIGFISSKIIEKYIKNKEEMYKIINISSSAGIAVALGSPIGGILYSIEELKIKFTARNIVLSFFCSLTAIMTFHLYDPFRTGKIVMFQSKTSKQWKTFEIPIFMIIGILGAMTSAFIIKVSVLMSKIRRYYKFNPIRETFFISLFTSLVSFSNRYLKFGMISLLQLLFEDCAQNKNSHLCKVDKNLSNFFSLGLASVVRTILISVTYGCTAPTGIFIPSMAVGACFGRAIGTLVQYLYNTYPESFLFQECPSDSQCVNPEMYALLGAASGLCGITKLCLTVVVIMFELTGALQYMLPTMITVASTKFIGDFLYKDGIAEEFIASKGIPTLEKFENDVNCDILKNELNLLTIKSEDNIIDDLIYTLEYTSFRRVFVQDCHNNCIIGYVLSEELRTWLKKHNNVQGTKVSFTKDTRDHVDLSHILIKDYVIINKPLRVNALIDIFLETRYDFVLLKVKEKITIVNKKDVFNAHVKLKHKH